MAFLIYLCIIKWMLQHNRGCPLFQDGVMLCKATAGTGVPLSLSPYIGATCPFIVFETADLDSAIDEVIEAAFKKKKEVMLLS